MQKGWIQIAFERDLKFGINRVELFDCPILLIKNDKNIRAFDALCPHRGAHLGFGQLENDACIICPFHGCKIGLNNTGDYGFIATEYNLFIKSGLVFINMSNEFENGFKDFFTNIDETHFIIPGFEMKVNVPPAMVIENAFDEMHFRTVHSIFNEPKFTKARSANGEYIVEGIFDIPKSIWQKGDAYVFSLPYTARAFSPYLVVSDLGGNYPYFVITSAVATKQNESCIRLSIAVKPNENKQPPAIDLCRYLIEQSKKGLELDKKIWETMSFNVVQRFTNQEKSVIGFKTFCNQFK